ncbi:MAG: 3'(2'),5'-bisphosphate nucleotidase CysQ [Bacteroidales bacterium]|nr:3'(2'),5'-bisphosphate nucleotidase CysQ [Bacteroidales bacterium]
MLEEQIVNAIHASILAGKAIMNVYSQDFSVELKADQSPLTLADQHAHEVIKKLLTPGIPLLSEEGQSYPYELRSNWEEYWLVDPLDGTKEFVKRTGEFTVNIARVRHGKPIAGIIYVPVTGLLYFGIEGYGSYRCLVKNHILPQITLNQVIELSDKLPVTKNEDQFVVASSVSHMNQETTDFIKNAVIGIEKVEYLSKGSSLKFCSLAEGTVDLYPRLGPTMEWDTAAGHAIARFAGCYVNEYLSGKEVVYNKENLLNPWFIAGRE